MDRLDSLLNTFTLHADMFFAGNICGVHDFSKDLLHGHLHLIRQGIVTIMGEQYQNINITKPTLVFLPRPEQHRLIVDGNAEVVCGTIQFSGGNKNPITDSLPDILMVDLEALSGVENVLDIMFVEAFSAYSGRQAILDRLCEILIIQLLRHCIDCKLTHGGTLAGLADERLAKVLIALHQNPAEPWDLSAMSKLAGMSRARFAIKFKEIIGETPADYLSTWRITIAQKLLKQGLSIKYIAYDVGYGSASALSRAFIRKLGYSPQEWVTKA